MHPSPAPWCPLMARDTRMSGISNGTDTCHVFTVMTLDTCFVSADQIVTLDTCCVLVLVDDVFLACCAGCACCAVYACCTVCACCAVCVGCAVFVGCAVCVGSAVCVGCVLCVGCHPCPSYMRYVFSNC